MHCDSHPISFINPDLEIEPRFLITEEKGIVFSANNSYYFSLYKFKDGVITPYDSLSNVVYPFLFRGKVIGLQDENGDEKYRSTDSSFNDLIGDSYFKSVYSFNDGMLFIIQLQNDGQVFIIDLIDGTRQTLLSNVQALHMVSHSEEYNFIVVNYDDKLVYIDLDKDRKVIELAYNREGNKMNPYIYKKHVYFVNNVQSEYFRIYKIDLSDTVLTSKLIHQTSYDLKAPKYDGERLYYIEVVNSEYLLRRTDLTSGIIEKITHKGIVYNYEFYDNHNIVYSYTDFTIPKSLMLYSKQTDSVVNFTGKSIQLDVKYKLLGRSESRSMAYLLLPSNDDKPKGIILFFRPGFHSDFSPRWELILSNLSANGFLVLAPNYPMSSGFGKSFYNAGFDAAFNDIKKWKMFIAKEYSQLPLYYLSASSGNILMEYSLLSDNKNVKASASLFGIPATANPNPVVSNLFIMGKNDPIVDFEALDTRLRLASRESTNISILSFDDEGHWFRKSKNARDAVQHLINHFCDVY